MVDYNYHSGTGLLASVVDVNSFHTYVSFSDYKPTGKMGQVENGDDNNPHDEGTITTYTYDLQSTRLTGITTAAPGGATNIQQRTYGYSEAGDIEEITDTKNEVTYVYTYDKLHRLKTETSGTYPAISYSYNATGNIMSRTVGTDTFSYTYDTNNKPHAVKSINGKDYVYDPNGNMTTNWDFTNPSQVAQRTIAYTADNMPKTITHQYNGTTTYKYDGGAVRAKKEVSGGSTTYYVSGDYEITAGVATRFIFAGNLRIAMVKGGDTHYFNKDHLGSSTVITNDTGGVAEETTYMPFGGMRTHSGTTVSNYKFTGQELDPESGLYNYNARLYDPMVGVFITPDSLVPDFTNPQCLNRYAYCVNSPLMYVDPSGQIFGIDDLLIYIVVSAVLNGVVSEASGGDFWDGALNGAIMAASVGIFGIPGGAIGGAVVAAKDDGNILEGATIGLIGTAAGYGIGIGLSGIENPYLHFATSVMGGGLLSGGIAELAGGSFADGFTAGAIGATLAYAYGRVVDKYKNYREKVGVESREAANESLRLIEAPTSPYGAAADAVGLVREMIEYTGDVMLDMEINNKVFLKEFEIKCGKKVWGTATFKKTFRLGSVEVFEGRVVTEAGYGWRNVLLNGRRGCKTFKDFK